MKVSKRNTRGVIVLAIICIAVAATPRILVNLKNENSFLLSFDKKEIIQSAKELKEVSKQKEKQGKSNNQKKQKKFKSPPATFNPNEYSKKDWVNLGLSEKQVDVILKFSKRTIRSNEDLRKIFVISDELFALIKDSTYYPIETKEQTDFKKESTVLLDLNSADVEDLKKIKGIGDFYANKIVEYRRELGGYLNKQQLLEIWKFDNEKLNQIENNIKIEAEVTRLNIKTATVDQLKNHPYISYSVANSIVKMREQHPFDTIDDIRKSKLIDDELFRKIKPYLLCQ